MLKKRRLLPSLIYNRPTQNSFVVYELYKAIHTIVWKSKEPKLKRKAQLSQLVLLRKLRCAFILF